MPDPLENYQNHETFSKAFSEVYEVVRTAEIMMDNKRYRIEVLKGYSNPRVPYSTRCYVEENVTLQPTYPITNGKHEAELEDMRVWVRYGLSSVKDNTAEGALAQTLSFLAD